jgi:parallel beta-helix repeat protein
MPLKSILSIAFLFISTVISATDYYISLSGNDSNNGLSPAAPWKTITKLNSAFATIKPGDRILFNRGDTFYGTITINKPGSSLTPIIIGAYGTGQNPIITGFVSVYDWTNEGNGIYSKSIISENNPNILTIDGVLYGMGRYPNQGSNLIIDSHSTNTSITDNDLNSTNTNWTGAEAVIRKNEYLMDRCVITSHISNTLTYIDGNNSEDASDGYYYFIQNDIRTLDQFGEWYYNGTRLYVYFGSKTPSDYIVKVATLDHLVYINLYPYVTIDGLSFEGANDRLMYFKETAHINVQNCNIDYSGGSGIFMQSNFGAIDKNIINNISEEGIFSLSSNTTITNNQIHNIGIIEGSSLTGSHQNGINTGGDDVLIQSNTIDSTGYIPIIFNGNRVTVKNNLISNYCLNLNDGGGIFTNGTAVYTGRIIDGNIILNGIGKKGISSYGIIAGGIYLDSYSRDILITNNSIYHCSGNAIMLSNASNITLRNNTCFDNIASVYILEWGSSNSISNITLEDNLLVAKYANQVTMEIQSNLGTLGSFGTADRNYYARPIDDNTTIYTYEGQIDNNLWKPRTLANWQSYSKQDANSHKSSISITNINDFRFEYNASQVNKVITLSQPMIDIKGIKYSGSITLLPYTSSVLMVDPNPTQVVTPTYIGSVVENISPSLLQITYNVNLANIVPASSSFTVLVNGVKRNINTVDISGNKVQLTLASAIAFGDKISLSYTKPASNWIRSVSSVDASSFTLLTVTNNLLNIVTNRPDSALMNEAKIVIYPNPINKYINIRIINQALKSDHFRIIDLNGKIVLDKKLDNSINEFQYPINLIAGIYIIQVVSSAVTVYTQKVIVIR